MDGNVLAGTTLTSTVRLVKPAAGKAPDVTVWKHRHPYLIAKLAAVADGHVAVAYWGGIVDVLDKDGKRLASQKLPQDVTALTWSRGKLLAGLADGRVLALTARK